MFLPFCCVFKGHCLSTLQPGNGLPTCLLYGSKLNRFTDQSFKRAGSPSVHVLRLNQPLREQSFTSARSPKGVFLNSPPRLCLRLGKGFLGPRVSTRFCPTSTHQLVDAPPNVSAGATVDDFLVRLTVTNPNPTTLPFSRSVKNTIVKIHNKNPL